MCIGFTSGISRATKIIAYRAYKMFFEGNFDVDDEIDVIEVDGTEE